MHLLQELLGIDSLDDLGPGLWLTTWHKPTKQARSWRSWADLEEYARNHTTDLFFGQSLHRGEYNSDTNRPPAAESAGIFGFWADLDTGIRNHKQPFAELADAVVFSNALPFRPSRRVKSGGGLHAYWLFKEPWIFDDQAERVKAARLAKAWQTALQNRAKKQGATLDSVADLARVLRVPGTTNSKYNKLVTILEAVEGDRYDPSEFQAWIDMYAPKPPDAPGATLGGLEPFTADPNATAPLKWHLAMRQSGDPRIRATWTRNRRDLPDQSTSSYDMALANYGAQNGLTDREISDTLSEFRRVHPGEREREGRARTGKSLQDYHERTIAKARASQASRDAEKTPEPPRINQTTNPPEPEPVESKIIDLHAPPAKQLKEWARVRDWTVAELLAQRHRIPPDVVQDFIPGLSVGAFAGHGGSMKTYCVMDMACCISRGVPWLGLKTTQTPVLLFDAENRPPYLGRRWERIMAGHQVESLPNIITRRLTVHSLAHNEAVDEITYHARRLGAGFVSLDSLIDFIQGVEENSNSEMAPVAQRLREITDRAGATILPQHHVAKATAGKANQSPRGASVLFDNLDFAIDVIADGTLLTMEHDKSRESAKLSICARANWGPGSFCLSLLQKTFSGIRKGTIYDQAILGLVDATPGGSLRSTDLVKEVARDLGATERHVRRYLRELVEQGTLDRDGDPASRKPFLVWRPRHDS